MEPRVSKREKRLHLSYELPDRIHCSRVYPITAPNGSTVILYGHQSGLRVLWRGGKPLESTRGPQVQNGGKENDAVVMDDDDEDEDGDGRMAHPETQGADQYETVEVEQNADHPFPNIISSMDFESDAEILCIATPALSSLAEPDIPNLAKTHMLAAVATSKANVLLLSIPLELPSGDLYQKTSLEELDPVELSGDPTIVHDLSIKVFKKSVKRSSSTQTRAKATQSEWDGQVLIAAVAAGLNIWSLKLQADSISTTDKDILPIVHSTTTGHSVSFHPSPKSGQLAVASAAGVVRLYDVFATRLANDTTTQPLNPSTTLINQEHYGRWVFSFYSPFQEVAANASLARRKKILASSWILHGRGLLVLLEDGEWGIWDLSPPSNTATSLGDFALRGYLDTSASGEITDSGRQKKLGSKLAPMTPNTRKVKADNLFSGPQKVPGVASTGGVSISASTDRSGKSDESLIIWHDSNVYSIPSMQAFWQRSANSNGGLGSLHAPGLTHIADIDLMNESITSISQFSSQTTGSTLGQMNTQKDLLISTEHRLLISQQLQPAGPAKRLFQQALVERPANRDQQMLDVGEMDRLLEDMADNDRPRRVGFAT